MTVRPRDGRVAYIGQTVFVTSGSSSTTAQVALTASVSDVDGTVPVVGGTVTFTDQLTGKVLASGVKVTPLPNDPTTGTANVVVTLSSGQYGVQAYLIEVTSTAPSRTTSSSVPPPARRCTNPPIRRSPS